SEGIMESVLRYDLLPSLRIRDSRDDLSRGDTRNFCARGRDCRSAGDSAPDSQQGSAGFGEEGSARLAPWTGRWLPPFAAAGVDYAAGYRSGCRQPCRVPALRHGPAELLRRNAVPASWHLEADAHESDEIVRNDHAPGHGPRHGAKTKDRGSRQESRAFLV